jgi:hypothetical protein
MKVISVGELIEKATRVLTPEERVIFDTDWIGKDGSKRKLEVCSFYPGYTILRFLHCDTAGNGPAETEKVIPVRSQVAGS